MVDRPCFIVVHMGAGHHSQKLELEYKKLMASAARRGGQAMREQGDAMQAVQAAIATMEDAPIGNAGRRSNLTFKGAVECDASVMAGDGAFGAVGALSGVRNPVAAAARLAADSRMPLLLGRVRPMLLAGDSARQWSLEQGLEAAPSLQAARQWHVTEAASRDWRRYRRMIKDAQSGAAPGRHEEHATFGKAEAPCGAASPAQKRRRMDAAGAQLAAIPSSATEEDTDFVYDTVGAICVDAHGRVAAGVSSGGIAMKTDGRVGEAAIYGCGCWAADPEPGRLGVACSVTGVGEVIMRASLARACAAALRSGEAPPSCSEACQQAIREHVLAGQPAALPCPHNDAGILAVTVSVEEQQQPGSAGAVSGSKAPQNAAGGGSDGVGSSAGARRAEQGADGCSASGARAVSVELGVAHNSGSMAFGYWCHDMAAPRCCILRQRGKGAGGQAGASMCCEGAQKRWDVPVTV